MKKRNLVIVAFMLVAAMTIGVGYAALTATLTITGKAHLHVEAATEQILEDVFFVAATKVTGTGGSHTSDDSGEVSDVADNSAELPEIYNEPNFNPDTMKKAATITFDVNTLAQIGESVTFKYTILNNSHDTVTADLTLPTQTSQQLNAFKVDVQWADDSSEKTKTIASNDTAEVKVIVTLINLPNTAGTSGKVTESFTFGINATVPGSTTPTP